MDRYTDERRVAIGLAREAGAAIMSFYGSTQSEAKDGGSPVTAADHAANRIIVEGLRAAFPDDAILSDESADSEARLDSPRVWIVDPLDGTKEFLGQNGEFSVMIGLVEDGQPVVGVVYLPDGDVLYSAALGQGAEVERHGVRSRVLRESADGGPPRLVGSRSHPDPLTLRIVDALGITDVAPCGSVGVKCSRIADGQRDLYVHPVPYLKEWDTCAPEVIAREAGLTVTDCRGGRLHYNKRNPVQPDGILVHTAGSGDEVARTVIEIYRDGVTGASV